MDAGRYVEVYGWHIDNSYMEGRMNAQISPENMISFLLTTPLFENLEPREVKEIIHIVDTKKFQSGDTIFREGDPGDAWYAIYNGEVEVLKRSASGEQMIRTLGPRSGFGEIAVLDNMPRSATIRAAKETTVLSFPRDKFNDMLAKDHPIACKLVKQLALMIVNRQRENTETLSSLLQTTELGDVHERIKGIVGESSARV